MLTDEEYLKANAHISDAELLQDIADTEREIREIEADPSTHPDSAFERLNSPPADRIAKRQKFIDNLNRLRILRSIPS